MLFADFFGNGFFKKELQTIIIYKADQGLVEYKFYKSTTENQTAC